MKINVYGIILHSKEAVSYIQLISEIWGGCVYGIYTNVDSLNFKGELLLTNL